MNITEYDPETFPPKQKAYYDIELEYGMHKYAKLDDSQLVSEITRMQTAPFYSQFERYCNLMALAKLLAGLRPSDHLFGNIDVRFPVALHVSYARRHQ